MKKYCTFLLLLLSFKTFSQINLSQGLIAYYPFSGNANDLSGNGNDPVFNNATLTTDRFGNPNSAYSFNGIDNYIKIPNSSSLNPTSQISLCAWVKVKGFYLGPCRGNSVLMKGITETSPAYKLRIDENNYPGNYSCGSNVDVSHEYFYGQGLGGLQKDNYDWIKTDQWYSIVYTYDGKTAKLYVDCELKMSVAITGLSMENDEDLFLGSTGLPGNYPYWFNGVMDEIRIYDRAINLTEVMAYGGCCKEVKSVTHDPLPVCAPGAINLFDPKVTAGSDPVLQLSYFADEDTTTPIKDPSLITQSGIYYIKGVAKDICTTVEPVTVTILERPKADSITSKQPTCTLATGSIIITPPDLQFPFYYSIDQNTYTNTTGVFSDLKPGTYTVTIKNLSGCISIPAIATINPQPVTPGVPVISTIYNCDGTITLSSIASGVLEWSNNATTPNIKVAAAGTYTLTQTLNGCTSPSASVFVNPRQPLIISATIKDITCVQPSGTITVLANNGIIPYQYSIDSGANYKASNIFNDLTAGSYVVKVKDSLGCLSNLSVIIKQNISVPNLKITDPEKICSPRTVDLTAQAITAGSDTGLTYKYFMDAAASFALVNANAVDKGGTYFIKGMKQDGCYSIKPISVLINPKSSFTITPDRSICNKDSIHLFASGGTTYLWQPLNLFQNANISNPVAAPTTPTTYTVKIKDSACNDSTILSTTISVLKLPVIKASKTNDIDCSNNFSHLNASGAQRYVWYPGSNLNDSTIANPIAKPISTTKYFLKGTDVHGCINIDTITVNVNYTNAAGYFMPNSFTPNNDGLNDCFGLKYWGNVTELQFSVYNRFGERVFYTTDPSKACWDGRYKGQPMDADVFVYTIHAKTSCSTVDKKGSVLLVR